MDSAIRPHDHGPMGARFPDGFVWGTATAAHQVEGGNWNNDWWEWEHAANTVCKEPSGDACDHFWRYPEDLTLLADLGFGAYRFSIEWSRIEPEEGEFSKAALDHYGRMVDACHDRGMLPCITFHHFTTPRWAAADGGWANPAIVDRFGRFCERTVAHLGNRIALACTINEPNIVAPFGYYLGLFAPGRQNDADGAKRAADHFVSGHRRAYEVLKAGPGDFPVGLTLSLADWHAEPGGEELLAQYRQFEDLFLESVRGDDFLGVQAYTRTRVGPEGVLPPPPGTEVPSMGYEYWPHATEAGIRRVVELVGTPVYVTECGIGTDDDVLRIRYVHEALEGVARIIEDGLDVRGFFHWSLLDNFEWTLGYEPKFGLIAVDQTTQARTVKPSASWLGGIARTNRLP